MMLMWRVLYAEEVGQQKQKEVEVEEEVVEEKPEKKKEVEKEVEEEEKKEVWWYFVFELCHDGEV